MFDLDAIKRRRAAITSAPWEKAHAGSYTREQGRFVITEYFVRRPEDDTAIAAGIIDPDTDKPHEGNAEFIAHAPTDIDALIAEVERLHGVLDRATKQLDRLNNHPLFQRGPK